MRAQRERSRPDRDAEGASLYTTPGRMGDTLRQKDRCAGAALESPPQVPAGAEGATLAERASEISQAKDRANGQRWRLPVSCCARLSMSFATRGRDIGGRSSN